MINTNSCCFITSGMTGPPREAHPLLKCPCPPRRRSPRPQRLRRPLCRTGSRRSPSKSGAFRPVLSDPVRLHAPHLRGAGRSSTRTALRHVAGASRAQPAAPVQRARRPERGRKGTRRRAMRTGDQQLPRTMTPALDRGSRTAHRSSIT